MLQVKNTRANTISGATTLDCLVLTSVSNSDCINTVSPTFTTCTGDYNVSSDTTATGANSLLSQPIASWLDGSNDINTTGQTALTSQGWNGSDIASAFYAVDGGGSTLVNLLQFGSLEVSSIKFCEGGILKSVELMIDNVTVWRE